ncbi:MAG: GNAT family N-acetyltransferase [Spirochaetaceae bacterium]|nr:GNAT family N-acetyltransferase [Spirochaetaceae bacterium]
MNTETRKSVKITTYRKEHVNLFITLYRQIFNSPPWNEEWDEFGVEKMILKSASRKRFLGYTASIGNKAIGFLIAYPLSPFFPFNRIYYLSELFIHQNIQGRGIGEKLCLNFFTALSIQNSSGVILLTQKNSPAEKFYMKIGFNSLSSFIKIQGKIIMYLNLQNNNAKRTYYD